MFVRFVTDELFTSKGFQLTVGAASTDLATDSPWNMPACVNETSLDIALSPGMHALNKSKQFNETCIHIKLESLSPEAVSSI